MKRNSEWVKQTYVYVPLGFALKLATYLQRPYPYRWPLRRIYLHDVLQEELEGPGLTIVPTKPLSLGAVPSLGKSNPA